MRLNVGRSNLCRRRSETKQLLLHLPFSSNEKSFRLFSLELEVGGGSGAVFVWC